MRIALRRMAAQQTAMQVIQDMVLNNPNNFQLFAK